MAADDAVQALLHTVGHTEPLDAEIIEYIEAVVAEPDPETTLEVLIGVLADCVGSFAVLSEEQQAALVLKLLDDVSD